VYRSVKISNLESLHCFTFTRPVLDDDDDDDDDDDVVVKTWVYSMR
jgi:hypothetical protein